MFHLISVNELLSITYGSTCFAFFIYGVGFQIVDPGGIANWSVTHVDWSEGKWHPKAYRAQDVSYGLFKNITVYE